ncbi:MAG: HlyC/CorC family transporter [Ignavibacteria bacterium]|nr:HlyC/CorC family transporter [Ignavibacteria bacterium]
MESDLIILFILLLLSAFFSASELAFIVANKLKIELRARKNNFSAKQAFYFNQNPQMFFSTILIANNIANIAFSSIFAVFVVELFNLDEIYILLISTTILLLFGELLPKYFAREYADFVILLFAPVIRIINYVIYPFVKIISSISAFFTKSVNINEENNQFLYSKEEFQKLVQESEAAGKVDKNNSGILHKVFELGEQKIYEAISPRTEIVGVEINSSIDEVINKFIQSGYSKLPVYEENLDNIKGVVFAYDLFENPQNLKSIMREVIFVPDTKKSLDMLNEFLKKHASIAIVVDEFGGTAGIITLEDIMEELFGEIRDEYDVDENVCKKIDENTFVFSAKIETDYINEQYNLGVPDGDYETIGGYITTRIGRIPVQGENLTLDWFNIIILRSSKTKIDLLKLIVDTEKMKSV